MDRPAVKTRFAPSPTGLMHLGNVRAALFNALYARARGGRFLLRIEDTDRERSQARYLDALLEDLHWLGLDYDEGPGRDEPEGGARQSDRGGVYGVHFERLLATDRAYSCFCTEAELARARAAQRAAGQPPRYSGTCARLSAGETARRLAAGEPATVRFRVPAGRDIGFTDLVRGGQRFATDDIGDFVIRRADGSAAFFFSNAVDDALMGVTDVLRGEDHLTNTPRQRLLLEALDLPVPRYGHLAMLVGPDGAPLAKRHGSRSVAELRAEGYLPEALLNHLARLGHTLASDELLSLDGLAGAFSLERLGRAPARFDPAQLAHWQALAVAEAPAATLAAWLPAGVVPDDRREAFLAAVRPNSRFPAELADWAGRLFGAPAPALAEDDLAVLREAGPGFFAAILSACAAAEPAAAGVASLREATGRGGRALFMPLRLALTGVRHGPGLAEVLALMPPPLIRDRLSRARVLAQT